MDAITREIAILNVVLKDSGDGRDCIVKTHASLNTTQSDIGGFAFEVINCCRVDGVEDSLPEHEVSSIYIFKSITPRFLDFILQFANFICRGSVDVEDILKSFALKKALNFDRV